jgi:DegV family protein with EDD domain
VYKHLLEDGFSIVSIHLSGAISGTYEAAMQAQRILGTHHPLVVHDSASVSAGTSLQILAAAEAIQKGADLLTCRQVLAEARDRCHVYFSVSTLKYLVRGGRIRWTTGTAANLAGIRPILSIQEGQLRVAGYALSRQGARQKMARMVARALRGTQLRFLGAAYTDDPQISSLMCEQVAHDYGILVPRNALTVPLSPVIGAYTGPGAYGIAFINQ